MKKQLLAGLAFLGAVVAPPAMATVSVGDTVTCSGESSECSNIDAIVSNDVEFGIDVGGYGTLLNADFSAGLLTIRNADNPDATDFLVPDGFKLVFGNETSPFTFAALGDIDGVSGFGASNLTLNSGLLTLDLGKVTFTEGSSFQVRFDQTPPQGAVPEPATWALMILGFGVVGTAMRRRKVAAPLPRLV